MKSVFKYLVIIPFFTLFIFTSCQEETIEETPVDDEQVIAPNSALANLMTFTSSNDGSVDDILDNADCFSINLPVTVTVNNFTINITTLEDLELIEDILDEFDDDEDLLEFLFPITITFNDFDTIVIENEDELEDFIEECLGDDDDDEIIECVDFQYPISFSIFNSDFVVIDTVVIDNDEELYDFLEDLEDGENGAVLASLNYPVTLIYANGDTIEVNSNQELEAAINAADDDCADDDDQCDLEQGEIESALLECDIEVEIYNDNNSLVDELQFNFNEDSSIIVNGEPAITEVGNWTIQETDAGFVLVIEGLNTFAIANGSWILEECEDDDDDFELEFTKDSDNGEFTMELEQDCDNDNPFDCFEDTEVEVCDDDVLDGITEFNLNEIYANCPNDDVEVTFHVTLVDAESNVNPLTTPYANVANPQTIYARVQLAGTDIFEIFEVDLLVENCDNDSCTEAAVDDYLQTCEWNVINLNGDNGLSDFDLVFTSNNELVITMENNTYTGYWSTSTTDDGVLLELANINGPDIQAISGFWLLAECDSSTLGFLGQNDNSQTLVLDQDCE